MSVNAVVFLGMVYPGGIIRHLALLGIELGKIEHEYDYYFASIMREPDRNAWALVHAALPKHLIMKVKTFDEVVKACDTLFTRYERVLIHCGGGWGQTRAFIPLRRKYGHRLVLVGTTHSYHLDSWIRVPMSVFQCILYLRYYDKIIFQCQYAVDMFWGSHLLFLKKKGIVIPLGCELFDTPSESIPPVIAGKEDLRDVLEDQQLFKFVYLAGFRPGKKHVWLVYAIAPILKKHPEVRVLFCGTGNETVIRQIQVVIKRLGLQKQILMTGQIPRVEIPWLLLHADCAVVPSRAETFGHNFLEPMFAGLPVLGTRVGIGRDLIHDGLTGYGFDLKNVQSLRCGAEQLLACRERVKEMGKRAKRIVEKDFTHAVVARQLNTLYHELLLNR